MTFIRVPYPTDVQITQTPTAVNGWNLADMFTRFFQCPYYTTVGYRFTTTGHIKVIILWDCYLHGGQISSNEAGKYQRGNCNMQPIPSCS